MLDYIKKWDNELIQKHIMNEVSYIRNFFNPKGITKLNYIDIGANVGKFYDVLKHEYEIESVVMVEPAPMLNEYLKEKFKDTKNCKIWDFAISDQDGKTNFSIDSILCSTENHINMGVSKISGGGGIPVKMVSAQNFLLNYINELDKINLIKIDTENRDYNIIKSMKDVIKKMKKKPLILFEHNHRDVLTNEEAEQILNEFTNECGYENINYSKVFGDWYIKPL
jgi:FkbM family methyltransferase